MSRERLHPWWVILMVIATIATVFTMPLMIGLLPREMGMFIVFYPLMALIGGLICWWLYPTRRDIYWTLMLVIWMSFVLMWLPLLTPYV